MNNASLKLAFSKAPIVPVLTIPQGADVAKLAETLLNAGLTTVEVTLRTDAALSAIVEMKKAAPDLLVGAGTILSANDMAAALDAGSDFLVSPGMPAHLLSAAQKSPVPFLPGIATPTEAMHLSGEGFEILKLFPAAVVGGVGMLKAMSGPLKHISFMPTGGVTPTNLKDYIDCPNVVAVGGTWLAREDDIASGRWATILELATNALTISSPQN